MEKKGYRKWLSTLAIITLALVVSISMAPISVRAASGKAKSIALDHSTYTLKKGSKVKSHDNTQEGQGQESDLEFQ